MVRSTAAKETESFLLGRVSVTELFLEKTVLALLAQEEANPRAKETCEGDDGELGSDMS
jgi:hypothetical protein